MLRKRFIALSLTLLYLGLAPALAACRWQPHDAQHVAIGPYSHGADAQHQHAPSAIYCDLRNAYALASSRTAPLVGLRFEETQRGLVTRDHSIAEPPSWRRARFRSVSMPVTSSRLLSFVSVFRL